jgi:hypothetical protein
MPQADIESVNQRFNSEIQGHAREILHSQNKTTSLLDLLPPSCELS